MKSHCLIFKTLCELKVFCRFDEPKRTCRYFSKPWNFNNQRVSLSCSDNLLPKEFYRKQYSEFIYFPPCSNASQKIMSLHDVDFTINYRGRALVQQRHCLRSYIITPNGGEGLNRERSTGHLMPFAPQKIRKKSNGFWKIKKESRNEESVKSRQGLQLGELCKSHFRTELTNT